MISRCSAAIALASSTASSSVPDHDDGAEIVPRGARDVGAGQRRELGLHRAFDLGGEPGAVGDQDRLRARIVLGLRQQIGGDPAGIAGVVGDDEHFRGAGDHVDADLAEHLPLGGGDIGVAGADDFGDRRDRRRAVGQRRHRLRAADAIDFGDAAKLAAASTSGLSLPPATAPPSPRAPRRPPWPARHSSAPRTDSRRCRRAHRARPHRPRPAPAELDAQGIGEALVLRQLPLVEQFRSGRGRISVHRAWRRRRPPTAASISAPVTRRPEAAMSSRSNFFVASIRAASPRAATSSTIARVARSTSAETSRLAARNCLNSRPKSALLVSRRTGMAAF